MFVVVSYDIPDNKRRLHLAKILIRFGDRVQLSVFECNLEKRDFERMVKWIRKEIAEEKDSVRIYKMCEHCKSEISILGLGKVSENPDLIIV